MVPNYGRHSRYGSPAKPHWLLDLLPRRLKILHANFQRRGNSLQRPLKTRYLSGAKTSSIASSCGIGIGLKHMVLADANQQYYWFLTRAQSSLPTVVLRATVVRKKTQLHCHPTTGAL